MNSVPQIAHGATFSVATHVSFRGNHRRDGTGAAEARAHRAGAFVPYRRAAGPGTLAGVDPTAPSPFGDVARRHVAGLEECLANAEPWIDVLDRWGTTLAARLDGGARLVVCGNGGSAAEASHLAGELVGHFVKERPAWAALALNADGVVTSAIANDYGAGAVFARQVEAHVREGDVFLALSTSGRSANVLAAVDAARRAGATTWAFTGPAPNPLAAAVDEHVAIDGPDTSTVQEVHQVLVHLLVFAVEAHTRAGRAEAAGTA
jgi:D-sedoheptulose 7-phosphate isomerase